MSILDAIVGDQGQNTTQQLGQQFGLSDTQVTSALSALVPAVAAGFQNHASNPQSLEGLLAALGGGQHQQYIDDPSTLARPETTADGNGILGHIFGSKDVSRDVASRAAAQTGLDPSVLKGLLPVVAAMVMGRMSRHVASSPTAATAGTSGENPLAGLLAPMLDSGGGAGGSIAGELAGMLGRFAGR